MPSTVISTVEYDASTETLSVTYVSGNKYNYKHVPPAVYDEMKRAFSKGIYLNKFIKGKYDFEKVNDD